MGGLGKKLLLLIIITKKTTTMLLSGIIMPVWLGSALGLVLTVVWIAAVISVINNNFREGEKLIWFLLVLLPLPFPFFGPLYYFLYGKKRFTVK